MRLHQAPRTDPAEPVAGRASPTRLPADRTAAVRVLFAADFVHLVRLARLLVDDQVAAEGLALSAFASLHRRWAPVHEPDEAAWYLRGRVVDSARRASRRSKVLALSAFLGLSDAEIASALGISRTSVRAYRHDVHRAPLDRLAEVADSVQVDARAAEERLEAALRRSSRYRLRRAIAVPCAAAAGAVLLIGAVLLDDPPGDTRLERPMATPSFTWPSQF